MTTQGFVGADPEQLDALADRLDRGAESLAGIRSLVGVSLGQVDWSGRDGDQFRAEWRSRHLPVIGAACTALQDTARGLRSNAAQQRAASGTTTTSSHGPDGPSGPGGPGGPGDPGDSAGAAAAGVTGHRDWHEVQQGYDAWAAGKSFAQPDYQYQCTSWANYRWHELGYPGAPIHGDGWQMAQNAGPVSAQPSLHAMASYGDGRSDNHVMIVEEVDRDGTVRFSEMNVNNQDGGGHPNEYRDNRVITPAADGKYYVGRNEIRFAAFPQ